MITKDTHFQANKIDLRDEGTVRQSALMISTEEGETVAQEISANRFIECSAKRNTRISDVIEEALRAAIHGPIVKETKSRTFCCLRC